MLQLNKKMILALALLAAATCACAVPPGSLITTAGASPIAGPSTRDTTIVPAQTTIVPAQTTVVPAKTTSVPAQTTVVPAETTVAGPLATSDSTGLPTTPVVITPTAPETSPAFPTSDAGFPAQPKPGVVTTALGQATYQAGQTIVGMVLNGLGQSIYSADMKTDCSIVTLEQLKNGSWEPVPGCNSLRAPTVVEIGTMRGQGVSINPLSTNFGVAPASKTPAFGAGTYRLRFSYRLAPQPEGEEPLVVFSETFAVRP